MLQFTGTALGTLMIFGMCAIIAGALGWLILGQIAVRQRLSGPMELLLEFLPEQQNTTPQGLNRAIRAIIRRAAIPGPNSKRAMSLAVIRLRPEDLEVLNSAYGIDYYTAELGTYHRKVASRKGWEIPPGQESLVVRFVEDPDRKPMRPALDAASSAAVLPDGTRAFGRESDGPAGDARKTSRQAQKTKPIFTGQEGRTDPAARFVGPGIDRLLFPADAPFTIGRGHENHIVLPGETVHRQHARLDYSDGHWTIVPLKTVNSTLVNGARIIEPANVTGTAEVSFGDSGSYTFTPGR